MNKDIDYRNLFDFPCSPTYRGYEAELNGEYLPHIDMEEKPPQDVEVIEYRMIKTHDRQLTRKVLDNENAIKYLLDKQAGKGKKPSSYF